MSCNGSSEPNGHVHTPIAMAEAASERFEALLAELTKSMPDAESAENISAGIRRAYDSPALESLEQVTRRTYNLSQARTARTPSPSLSLPLTRLAAHLSLPTGAPAPFLPRASRHGNVRGTGGARTAWRP